MKQILINTLYLLAIINPVSKISLLSVFASAKERREIIRVSLRASLGAVFIVALSMVAGEFLLNKIFHLDFYSLQIAGGVVLFWVGFNALIKGVFFEHTIQEQFSDISLAPLACPMIAGPATITAIVTLRVNFGTLSAVIPALLAIGINLALMMQSVSIGKALARFNILGALIRLTGLIVVTMGVQMALEGISMWFKG
jgi:multiple antibiotic resistance protein